MNKILLVVLLSLALFSNGFNDDSGLTAAKDKYDANYCTLPIGVQDVGINPKEKLKDIWDIEGLSITTLRNSGLVPSDEKYSKPDASHGAGMIGIIANVYGVNGKFIFANLIHDFGTKSYDNKFLIDSGVGVISKSIETGGVSSNIISKFENLLLYKLRDGLGGIIFFAAGNEEENIDKASRWGSGSRLRGTIVIGFLDKNGKRTASDFPATSGYGRDVIYIKSYGYGSHYPTLIDEIVEETNEMTTSRATAWVSGVANLALCINPKLTGDELENIVRAAAPRNEHGYFTLVPADILRFAHALKWEANPTENIKGNVSLEEVMNTLKELRRTLSLVKLNKKIKPKWNLLGIEDKYSLSEFKKFVNIENEKIYKYKTGDLILNNGKLDIETSQWIKFPQEIIGGIWIYQGLSEKDKKDLLKIGKRSLPKTHKKELSGDF